MNETNISAAQDSGHAMAAAAGECSPPEAEAQKLIRRHLALGWWSLLMFLVLGLALETLHGFKVDFYLSVSNETRRLMWTLAHAHGTFLSLVHIAFAATIAQAPAWSAAGRRRASWMLTAAAMLVPAGFFLGGVVVYGGDPGLGILLVPVGALLLTASVISAALGASSP